MDRIKLAEPLTRRAALAGFAATAIAPMASARETTLTMASPRASHVALSHEGGVLMIGGFAHEGVGLDSVEKYDARLGYFRLWGRMTRGRIQPIAERLGDGRILVMGGEYEATSSAEISDKNGRFRNLGAMRMRRNAAASCLLKDGRVFVCGGDDRDGGMSPSAEVFDPRTERFSAAPNMSAGRAGHTATVLQDGRVLIAGGGTGSRDPALASAEIFDPATGVYAPVSPMSKERFKHGAVLSPTGDVVVVGGSDNRSGADGRGRLAACEVFDPKTKAFRIGPSLVDARYKLQPSTVIRKDGTLIVASGSDAPEQLAPGKSRFSRISVRYDMRRDYMAAAILGDGSIVAAGGYDARIVTTAKAWRIAF